MELTASEKAKLTAKWATTMTKWHIGFVTNGKALGIGDGQDNKALAELDALLDALFASLQHRAFRGEL